MQFVSTSISKLLEFMDLTSGLKRKNTNKRTLKRIKHKIFFKLLFNKWLSLNKHTNADGLLVGIT